MTAATESWDDVPVRDCYTKVQGQRCGPEHGWASWLGTFYRCPGTRTPGVAEAALDGDERGVAAPTSPPLPVTDPFRGLREGLADGSIKVWCYCEEFDGPEPPRWVPPDDYHADVCCLDHARTRDESRQWCVVALTPRHADAAHE